MTMTFTPYLNFDGTCREAFDFYESVLGGEMFVMSNGDMPPDEQFGPEWEDLVVHASLTIGDGFLMGSDAPPDEAVGGIRHTTGDPDRPPARCGVSLGDSLAGVLGAASDSADPSDTTSGAEGADSFSSKRN